MVFFYTIYNQYRQSFASRLIVKSQRNFKDNSNIRGVKSAEIGAQILNTYFVTIICNAIQYYYKYKQNDLMQKKN